MSGKYEESYVAKYRQVDELRKTMTAKAACERVGAGLSNYFNWKSRQNKKASPKAKRPKTQPIVMHVNAPTAHKYAVAFMDLAAIRELMSQ